MVNCTNFILPRNNSLSHASRYSDLILLLLFLKGNVKNFFCKVIKVGYRVYKKLRIHTLAPLYKNSLVFIFYISSKISKSTLNNLNIEGYEIIFLLCLTMKKTESCEL